MSIFAGLGLGPGRRGHHRLPHLQRHRQLDPLHRRHARLRGHRAGHVPDGRGPDRGGHHAADPGDLPGQPVRRRRRHGRHPGHRRPPRPDRRRGRLPGPRRPVSRPSRGQLRLRGLQPVRHQEHDHRRGRLRHHQRRPAGRLDQALPQPGHARALPPRDPRLQLPHDRHRRGHRPRPARQARAEHGPPPGDRASATTRPSPTCRSSCRPGPRAGRTSSTSTPSASDRPATRSWPR